MLEGDRVKNGSILLVSDLETAPDDVPETARVLRAIKRKGTPVRLLALGPSSDARALFGGILGPEAFTPLADGPVRQPEPPDARRRPLPRRCSSLGRSSWSRSPGTSATPAGSRAARHRRRKAVA